MCLPEIAGTIEAIIAVVKENFIFSFQEIKKSEKIFEERPEVFAVGCT